MRLRYPLLLAGTAALATVAVAQNIRATGKINETYTQLCANCHGPKLEGGMTPGNNKVPSLLTDTLLHGNDDASLMKSIKEGYPLKEMPPWGGALSDADIRSMVIFIREQQFKFKQGQIKIEKLPDSFAGKSQLHDFQINTWVADVIEPYDGAGLMPDHQALELLVARPQRRGTIRDRRSAPGR